MDAFSKIFSHILFLYIVSIAIQATDHGSNDVEFDFNKYYKVIISTNQSSNDKMVTLYNPDVWPGPDDTFQLTTPSSQSTTKPVEIFGVRRSSVNSRNRGYGYEQNSSTNTYTNGSLDKTLDDRILFQSKFDHISRDKNHNYNPIPRHGIPFDLEKSINNTFRCELMQYYGYYADVESNCQLFHVCTPDGRKVSFICPNKLLFNQRLIVCDWNHNVDCKQSPHFYQTNRIKFNSWNSQSPSK